MGNKNTAKEIKGNGGLEEEDLPALKEAPECFYGFCRVPPIPKQRPRFSMATRRAYTDSKTRKYLGELGSYFFKEYGDNTAPMGGAIEAVLIFYVEKPKSKSNKVLYPEWKPDVDNLVKSFLDGTDFSKLSKRKTAGVLENDSRIVRLLCEKRYASDERPVGTAFLFRKLYSGRSMLEDYLEKGLPAIDTNYGRSPHEVLSDSLPIAHHGPCKKLPDQPTRKTLSSSRCRKSQSNQRSESA